MGTMPHHDGRRTGDARLLWTNVFSLDFISDDAGVFVYEYHLPEQQDPSRAAAPAERSGGGRLGVVTGLTQERDGVERTRLKLSCGPRSTLARIARQATTVPLEG